MRDWQELVRGPLCGLALEAPEKDEIKAELAAHLEDAYEELRRKGWPEKQAVHRTRAGRGSTYRV